MRRIVRFGLLLDPEEKHALTRLAEMEGGLSAAALLRHLIHRAADERGLWPHAGTQVADKSIRPKVLTTGTRA